MIFHVYHEIADVNFQQPKVGAALRLKKTEEGRSRRFEYFCFFKLANHLLITVDLRVLVDE